MDGPDEAVEPVPAEPLSPVDGRLEHREGERGGEEQRDRAGGEHAGLEPGSGDEPPAFELEADAHGS